MAEGLIFSEGGGVGSDECTATKAMVLEGYTALTSDSNDEPATGTMTNRGTGGGNVGVGGSFNIPSGYYNGSGYVYGPTLSGNASAAHVLSGETFYSNSGTKQTGSMQVASLTSFSAAVANGKSITLSWTVPTAQSGRPYSGVIIRYGTSTYPTSLSSGTHIYRGAGNSTTPGSTSSVTVKLPNLGTTYYFSIWFYATCSAGTSYDGSNMLITNSYLTAYATTKSAYWAWITGNTTVPDGYTATLYLIGAGGGGSNKANSDYGGNAGGSGYVTTIQTVVSGTPILDVVIGAGGSGGASEGGHMLLDSHAGGNGGTTSCKIDGYTYTASGGNGGPVDSGTGGTGYKTGGKGGKSFSYDRPEYYATSGSNGILLNGTYYGSSGGGGGHAQLNTGKYYTYANNGGSAGSGAGAGGGGGYNNGQNGGNASTAGSSGGGGGLLNYWIAQGGAYDMSGAGGKGANGGILAYYH